MKKIIKTTIIFLVAISVISNIIYAAVPGINASVEEIYGYLSEIDKLDILIEKVDNDSLIKWSATLREHMEKVNADVTENPGKYTTEEYEAFFKIFTLLDKLINRQIDINEDGSSDIDIDKIIDDYYEVEIDPNKYTEGGYEKYHLASVEGEDRVVHSNFKDVLNDTDGYNPNDENPPTEYYTIVSKIVSVITGIGTVVSILIIAILGIKYMLGSVEEKAEYKKDMIPYLVGAGLLFGVTAIVGALQKLGETINNI